MAARAAMSEGTPSDDAAQASIDLPATPPEVWRLLVDRSTWWPDLEFDAVAGSPLRETWTDGGRTFEATGRVLAVDAPTRLSFEWTEPGWSGFLTVTVTVSSASAEGAEVIIVEQGFAEIAGMTGGGPWAVVNNAGYAQSGAVEDVSDEQVRAQLETNVVAPMRIARLVLPAMKSRGEGRIVNISSVAGRTSQPLMGWYCASKHALEAVTDALRMEVEPDGVRVVGRGGQRVDDAEHRGQVREVVVAPVRLAPGRHQRRPLRAGGRGVADQPRPRVEGDQLAAHRAPQVRTASSARARAAVTSSETGTRSPGPCARCRSPGP